MSASFLLRAAAAPERFLERGFVRLVARTRTPRSSRAAHEVALGLTLPRDLTKFLDAVGGSAFADFVPRARLPKLTMLLAQARRGGTSVARLTALLAGAVPFGQNCLGEVLVYFLSGAPATGLIASIAPYRLGVRLVCRGAAELALRTSLANAGEELPPARFGIAEEEHIHARMSRARALATMLLGTDSELRSAMKALAAKPIDMPLDVPLAHTSKARSARPRPFDLGPLFELFFRDESAELAARIGMHTTSPDALVRDAATLLLSALGERRRSVIARDLARRRELTTRTARSMKRKEAPRLELTRRIVARFDELPPSTDSFAVKLERDETLLALNRLGDPAIRQPLITRAVAGDKAAVEMLAALGDESIPMQLVPLLEGARTRGRLYETAVIRALVAQGARSALPTLRRLFDDNPLIGWREGLERGGLLRELVIAFGSLSDTEAASRLVAIVESTSQEYRTIVPHAAHALGQLQYAPSLPSIERLLFSPNAPVTSEAVWATGAIGEAHAHARERAASLLERLTGLSPGADITRLTALTKLRGGKGGPKTAELRRALDRALYEPAFRQDETARQHVWALRALEELAVLANDSRSSRIDPAGLFVGHETIRRCITRDDARVRSAARSAFAAWGIELPPVRPYFSFVLADLEREGGVRALIEAVRDPLGIFRHNVATRLGELGDVRAIRPLAEATALLFAEPATSTYEYDDAPPHLVAFVRALAKFNHPDGNEVLLEGLRSDNPQVRAMVAENAPEDDRFVPELMVMLEDARSFLRSRAEKSLTSLGALPRPPEPGTTEIAAVPRPRLA